MTKNELIKLEAGLYLLEDELQIFNYNLHVYDVDNKRLYIIETIGSAVNIFIKQEIIEVDMLDDNFTDNPSYNLSVTVVVGVLTVESNDVELVLNPLKLIKTIKNDD